MIWHSAGSFVLQIGTPLAAVRILAWLVALFGGEPFSGRAMLLLRRRLSHDLSVQAPEQALVPGSYERCPSRAGCSHRSRAHQVRPPDRRVNNSRSPVAARTSHGHRSDQVRTQSRGRRRACRTGGSGAMRLASRRAFCQPGRHRIRGVPVERVPGGGRSSSCPGIGVAGGVLDVFERDPDLPGAAGC